MKILTKAIKTTMYCIVTKININTINNKCIKQTLDILNPTQINIMCDV